MAASICDRCGQMTAQGVFKMWRGRFVRVGQDCAKAIEREKALGSGGGSTPGKLPGMYRQPLPPRRG